MVRYAKFKKNNTNNASQKGCVMKSTQSLEAWFKNNEFITNQFCLIVWAKTLEKLKYDKIFGDNLSPPPHYGWFKMY